MRCGCRTFGPDGGTPNGLRAGRKLGFPVFGPGLPARIARPDPNDASVSVEVRAGGRRLRAAGPPWWLSRRRKAQDRRPTAARRIGVRSSDIRQGCRSGRCPPVVRRVERWDGHVRVRVLALARNVDRRECQRRPAVDVRSRDVGVQPVLRLGEPRERRKTGACNGVRMRPDPAVATVSISLPRVNRWSTQMEWKGVIVCVEPGRLYEASGVPPTRCAT